MKDNFHGVDGMKRKRQNEVLQQIALLYICLQVMAKAIAYFVASAMPTLPKVREDTDKIKITHSNDIAMIIRNWIQLRQTKSNFKRLNKISYQSWEFVKHFEWK